MSCPDFFKGSGYVTVNTTESDIINHISMNNYIAFFTPPTLLISDASFITVFCLVIAIVSKFAGLDNNKLVVVFTMAMMNNAAVFPFQGKSPLRILTSALLVNLAIVAGGYLGNAHFILGEVIAIVLVSLAFYFPKNTADSALWITVAMMFVIFLFFPASVKASLVYTVGGVLVAISLMGLYVLLQRFFPEKDQTPNVKITDQKTRTITATLSITLGLLIITWLQKHTKLSHISWLVLTIMMVIQGSHGKTLATALKRTGVNIVGALLGVYLFTYFVPSDFFSHFIVLVILLFGIFCLRLSYFWRVLLIELFVFGLASIMGSFEPFTAIDRIVLTGIGCGIVIVITCLTYAIWSSLAYHPEV